MPTPDQRKKSIYDQEIKEGIQKYVWMSFVDPKKEKGDRFIGVIIIKAFGKTDAMWKSWDIGINPGGSISFDEWPVKGYKGPNLVLNKLLSKKELIKLGF